MTRSCAFCYINGEVNCPVHRLTTSNMPLERTELPQERRSAPTLPLTEAEFRYGFRRAAERVLGQLIEQYRFKVEEPQSAPDWTIDPAQVEAVTRKQYQPRPDEIGYT